MPFFLPISVILMGWSASFATPFLATTLNININKKAHKYNVWNFTAKLHDTTFHVIFPSFSHSSWDETLGVPRWWISFTTFSNVTHSEWCSLGCFLFVPVFMARAEEPAQQDERVLRWWSDIVLYQLSYGNFCWISHNLSCNYCRCWFR